MKKNYTLCLMLTLSLGLLVGFAKGQISITSVGVSYTENFDVLATTGTTNTWTDNTTLAGWYSQFQLQAANPTAYRADGGTSNTGAIYSWGVAGTNPLTERALGSVSSGTPGTIYNAVRLVNNTGSPIVVLNVAYNGEQWRQGGCTPTPCTPLSQKLDFQYQVAGAGTITDANTPATGWIDYDALDFNSPVPGTSTATAADGNAGANRTALSSFISVTINPGEEIWLRWSDANDANNDHGLAVDDFSVTAYSTPLDIRIGSITAENRGRANGISWINLFEDRGDVMELQSSADGRNFNTLTTIAAKGINNSTYSYSDNHAVTGVNYYRLKLTNISGLSTYSKTVTAVVKEQQTAMTLYPNPAKSSIWATCENAGDLQIVNANGQVVKRMKLQAGRNYIDVGALPSGIYQARYSNDTVNEWSRFIKN